VGDAIVKIMADDFFNNKADFFNRWAPNYDCLLTTVFYQAVHQRLLEYVDLPDGAQVLDLGCGTGRLLTRLAAKFPTLQGTGLDLSQAMLEQARQNNRYHPRLIYVQGNAESLPFAQGQFDAVFNTISFLHYPHPDKVFAQIRRVLRPQGRFYLADSTIGTLRSFPFSPGGIRFYSPQKREEFGKAAGMKCCGHYYLVSAILLSIFAPE
jgi:ubiquinone/menaquinone biosynthesis C-methylase UbiE